MARGDDFEKKAEKKLSGWSFFGSKADEAADLYDKAANCFKLAKNCKFQIIVSSHRVLGISLGFQDDDQLNYDII